MHYLLNNPVVFAAVISAFVSFLGVLVSRRSARLSALATLQSARIKLESDLRQINVALESLKQAELRDVLSRRLEAYPKLWSLLQTYVSNWIIEEKPADKKWVTDFLSKLNACHAEVGVLFSEPVYRSFYEFRQELIKVERKSRSGEQVSDHDLQVLEEIWSGHDGKPGVATRLKNDLGSYVVPLITAGANVE